MGQVRADEKDDEIFGGWINLDIDNNAVTDYQLIEASGVLLISPYNGLSYNSNSILGLGPGNFKYPFALSRGAPISAGASVWVNYPFKGGMTQVLDYTARWEQEFISEFGYQYKN